ncbi:YfgM family protein [Acinetobacter baumannii]|nr:tetratricopeptide repeat protein [Acinetobacter baumannii]EKX5887632.1 tetratricopeptide repeat protein [Acinetobacter baumannii]
MSLSDEEQFDSLKSFAKKYGSAMISGILIALIAFFGWEYWQKRNLATSQTETAKVQQLMDEANATADNPNALASITASADKIVKDDIDSVQAIQTQFVLAKLAYQAAWDSLLERKQERQILQIKLESVGVLVEDPQIERPILETQVEES